MSIFKDGYLKAEHLNPHYRGLVGWPITLWDGDLTGELCWVDTQRTIIFRRGYHGVFPLEGVRVHQFSPQDIPLGELCWFKAEGGNKWRLAVLSDVVHGIYYEANGTRLFDYCVPHLIANTAEEAEARKTWADDKA